MLGPLLERLSTSTGPLSSHSQDQEALGRQSLTALAVSLLNPTTTRRDEMRVDPSAAALVQRYLSIYHERAQWSIQTQEGDLFPHLSGSQMVQSLAHAIQWTQQQEKHEQEAVSRALFNAIQRDCSQPPAAQEEQDEDYTHYCPDCGTKTVRLIESTEPDGTGEYKDILTCDSCQTIIYLIRD